MNVAVTLFGPSIVTWQAPVPLQAPAQPPKVEALAGLAVRVTLVPLTKVELHVPGQLIPPIFEVTVPVPLPVVLTARLYVVSAVNVAVTLLPWFIVTLQLVPFTLSQPLHPPKAEAEVGAAVRVMGVPLTSGVLVQVPVLFVQLIPPALEVIVPAPEPVVLTFRV